MIKECIYALEQGEKYSWPEKFEIPEDLKENLTVKKCWNYIDKMFREVPLSSTNQVAPLNFYLIQKSGFAISIFMTEQL